MMVWGVLLEVSCGGVSGLRTSRSCDEEQCTGTECSTPRVCPSLCRPSVQAGCLSHTPHFVQPPLQAVLRSVHPSIHPTQLPVHLSPPTHTHTHSAPSFGCPFPQVCPPTPTPRPVRSSRAMPRVCLSVHALGALSTWPCTMLHVPLPAVLHPACPHLDCPVCLPCPYSLLSVSPPVPLSILSVCPHAMPRPSCPCLCLEVGTRCA